MFSPDKDKDKEEETALISPKVDVHASRYRAAYYACAVIAAALVITLVLLFYKEGDDSDQNDNDNGIKDPLLVATKYGGVKGFYFTSASYFPDISNSDAPYLTNTTVRAWRGIPFASPPIGNLRWMPPIAPPNYGQDALDCKEYKSYCVQANNGAGSEDCLYLNIYTTDPSFDVETSKGPWPVLFYIYGGGLMAGEARDDFNGLIYSNFKGENQYCNHSGLVVVEVAYRVNIFGFLATSELSQEQGGVSGNYGLQDQIMALEWVRDNIAAFNGDPDRVIVCGQSSGGTSIMALMAAPKSVGLIHGAFSMSGSPNIAMSLQVAEVQNAPIVRSSGCALPEYSYSDVNECMRNLSTSQVYDIIPQKVWNSPGTWGLPLYNGMGYQGLVIVDGGTVLQPFNTALAGGLVDIPIIFGNMACEPDEYPDNKVQDFTLQEWQVLLNQSFQPWGETVGAEMYALYLDDAKVNPQKAYDTIVSDYGLYCAQISVALDSVSSSSLRKSNTYLYYGEWALAKPFSSSNSSYEVRFPFHDVFYFELTNQWSKIGNGSYVPAAEDFQAQGIIQGNFWNFMLTLEPTSEWQPAVRRNSSNYSIFSINQSIGKGAAFPNYRRNICQYFKSIGLTSPGYWWSN